MSQALHFRIETLLPARPGEIPASAAGQLAGLLHACVLNGVNAGFTLPFTAADARAFWDRLGPSWRDGDCRIVMAHPQVTAALEPADGLAGALLLYLPASSGARHRAHLSLLLVHPDYRSRGVERALVTAAQSIAHDAGRTLLLLEAIEGSPADALCRASGFHRAGEIPGFAQGIGEAPDTLALYWWTVPSAAASNKTAMPSGDPQIVGKEAVEHSEIEERAVEAGAALGFGAEAVWALLAAFDRGGGAQAQFSHPELGGLGQWSGGMTMIGRMGDAALRERVATLAGRIATLMRDQPAARSRRREREEDSQRMEPMKPMKPMEPMKPMQPMAETKPWWPADLGQPASTGAQNDVRYASFPDKQRLLIETRGGIRTYDSGDRKITGFGQSQSSGGSGDGHDLVLSTDRGSVALTELKPIG